MATENVEVKVKIRRMKGQPPATCITILRGGGVEQWHPDADKDEFDVPPLVAYFAIKEGFFEQHPKSKVRLKTVAGQVTAAVEETEPPKTDDENKGGA